RRWRSIPGHLLQRRERRGRFARQPLHRRKPRGQTRAEVPAEGRRTVKRNLLIGFAFVSALVALVSIERTIARAAATQAKAAVMAPRFEVDPLWPKKLPNHWVVGQAIGLSV